MDLPDDWVLAFVRSNPLTLPAVAFRRRVFERVGMFFEDIPSCADWELLARTAMAFRWRYVPQRMITHHEHGTGVPDAEKRSMFDRMAILWQRYRPQHPLPPELSGQSQIFLA